MNTYYQLLLRKDKIKGKKGRGIALFSSLKKSSFCVFLSLLHLRQHSQGYYYWKNSNDEGPGPDPIKNFSVELRWILLGQKICKEILGQKFWSCKLQRNSMLKIFNRIGSWFCPRNIFPERGINTFK